MNPKTAIEKFFQNGKPGLGRFASCVATSTRIAVFGMNPLPAGMAVRCLAVLAAVACASAGRLFAEAGAALTPQSLRAAAAYSAAHGGLSLLVIQNGRVLFEQYPNGNSADQTRKIYSGTKAFWTTAAAAAEQDGLLRLDEQASDTIREWRRDPAKRDITLRELLGFTGGIAPGFALHRRDMSDLNSYALKLPAVASPGSRFIYGPSQLQIFCEVLRRKLAARNETPWSYLDRRILHPLGLRAVDSRSDAKGTPLLASGFKLTAREWAAFGQMVLGRGTCRDKKILRPETLDKCLRGSEANPAFGLAFWLNGRAGDPGAREFDIEDMLEKDWQTQDWRNACICRDAPAELLACVGSRAQRMFVIPSLNAVIVRQGSGGPFQDGRFLRILLGL
jgi:CubicO group peptidase (beta-lactamase class C family)